MTLCAATNTIVRRRNLYISTIKHVKEISHEKAVGSMHGEVDAVYQGTTTLKQVSLTSPAPGHSWKDDCLL